MARFSRKWEKAHEGFTLIELLIVIGIVVILSTAVVLALNPAELLRQARDSTRFQEIAVLNKGFSLFEFEGAPGGYGNASSTYFPSLMRLRRQRWQRIVREWVLMVLLLAGSIAAPHPLR